MEFLYLKKIKLKNNKVMNKVKIISIIYAIGILIGALFFEVWAAETSFTKTIGVFIWTIIFLITLFFADRNEKE